MIPIYVTVLHYVKRRTCLATANWHKMPDRKPARGALPKGAKATARLGLPIVEANSPEWTGPSPGKGPWEASELRALTNTQDMILWVPKPPHDGWLSSCNRMLHRLNLTYPHGFRSCRMPLNEASENINTSTCKAMHRSPARSRQPDSDVLSHPCATFPETRQSTL